MTGVGHADTAGEIQVTVAGYVVDVRTFSPFHDNVRDAPPHRRDVLCVHTNSPLSDGLHP